VLLVDGCGVLHPKGCGSACHVGVLEGLPSIGVAKNLLVVDGLNRQAIEGELQLTPASASAHLRQGAPTSEPWRHAESCSDPVGSAEIEYMGRTYSRLRERDAPGAEGTLSETVTQARSQHQEAGPAASPLMRCPSFSLPPGMRAIPLTGTTGRVWGAALAPSPGSHKPIYVSVGHRMSLRSAVAVVAACCRPHRTPEPIRQVS
jgi:endonuclease V